jgi:hypothetical protein
MKNQLAILSMLGLAITGITSFILLKKMIIIEVGAIIFLTGFTWELYGTKKGLWNNKPSPIYTIAGRLPIETALSYFFIGMVAASYVIFRLSI